jgi:hypothetical protein
MEKARLLIFYDETGTTLMPPPAGFKGVKCATLDLPNGLEGKDIYQIAKRLTELLLEQCD